MNEMKTHSFSRLSGARPWYGMTLLLCALSITGCSAVTGESDRYLGAESNDALAVPPDLTRVQPDATSTLVSAAAANATAEEKEEYTQFQQFQEWDEYQQYLQWKAEVGEPQEFSYEAFKREKYVDASPEEKARKGLVVLTSEEGKRRLLVYDNFEDTWERVGMGLDNLGVDIIRKNQANGVYTHYLPGAEEKRIGIFFWRSGSDELDTRVVQSDEGVLVSIHGLNGQISTEPEAQELLNRLASQLRTIAVTEAERVAAVTDGRANLRTGPDGYVRMALSDPIDRAWERIAISLDEAGFTVEERDRQDYSFVVRYVDQNAPATDSDEGVLEKMAFWRKDDPNVNAEAYSIVLSESGTGTEVQVLDELEKGTDTGDQILRILKDSLI